MSGFVTAQRLVKPVLSTEPAEARRRVISLYKAWYRQIPVIVKHFDIPKSESQCKDKLREMFATHQDVKDLRVIDMLVIKGQMELKETVNVWKQKGHLMTYWHESREPKPKDFLSKFFNGSD
ncbi:NADH dehydrogenase (ubiquinone) B14 subunit [Arctopsyche grandis]|uniref:NADH dehydrogenase (ubiquinone) B14 subunit n=1 Tax=Arctopsyche grandis TaxID=121162 RepID=UPI00406D7FDC